jgi:hypothetical protein
MRISAALRIGGLVAACCLSAPAQTAPGTPAPGPAVPGKDAPIEAKGLPPRAAPTDYQAHAKAGTVTIAADFQEHAIPTPQGPLSTEDYVVVETGLFGPPDARIKLAAGDFSLRINGKKPLPTQPYGLVIGNAKDPEWAPPEPPSAKSKNGISSGDKSQGDSGPPPPVVIPIGVQRAMAQRIQKAALPEGDRSLAVAGLIFFQYRGQPKGIHSVELIYAGPAGNVTLTLTP